MVNDQIIFFHVTILSASLNTESWMVELLRTLALVLNSAWSRLHHCNLGKLPHLWSFLFKKKKYLICLLWRSSDIVHIKHLVQWQKASPQYIRYIYYSWYHNSRSYTGIPNLVSECTISSVQSLSRIQLFMTPWTAACQASLSITNTQNLLQLMSVESVMPSTHLILCHPLLL